MFANPFSDAELAGRVSRVRMVMAERGLDALLLSTPENIFYLTGLDHWGYFAPHLLVVPADGEMTLITRAMERVTIEAQVRNADFKGHGDHESAADLAIRHLRAMWPRTTASAVGEAIAAPAASRLRAGFEGWSSGLPYAFGVALREALEGIDWHDASDLVHHLRLVKSPEEQVLMRRAAAVADCAAEAAIDALKGGTRQADVAAACIGAMIRAGGHPPGFGPFIRPKSRLGEEHATWGDGVFAAGEPVFLESAGCVSRYHAPLGRLLHVGTRRDEDAHMTDVAEAAFAAVLDALRPGAHARDVYGAWQGIVNDAGLGHYRRHHCGYCVGIGLPPSWTGGNAVTGLRHDSDLEIETGMSFHILSWLTDTGRGDAFISNTVLVGPDGAETLTKTPLRIVKPEA